MNFKEFIEQDQNEAWGDNLRKGILGTAIGAASLMPNFAQAQQPAAPAATASVSSSYSKPELQHIINILSEQLARGMQSNQEKIMELAKQDRNFSTFPDKAIRSAALAVTVAPLLGVNGPFREYKLVEAAENYMRGKEDNSQAPRISKLQNFSVIGNGLKGTIKANFNVDGRNIEVSVDSGGEAWVTAALIHKLGPQSLQQKSLLSR
jgi:hypothetical protein